MVISTKGQIFVAGAAVLVVLLALFRLAASDTGFETPTTRFAMDNLEAEYRHAAALSAKQDEDLLSGFSAWLRQESDTFDAYHMLIRPAAGGFAVDIGNYLRSQVNINITVSGATPTEAILALADKSVQSVGFTGGGTITLTVRYATPSRSAVETFTFAAGQRTLAFYDIGIRDAKGETRRRDIFAIEGE